VKKFCYHYLRKNWEISENNKLKTWVSAIIYILVVDFCSIRYLYIFYDTTSSALASLRNYYVKDCITIFPYFISSKKKSFFKVFSNSFFFKILPETINGSNEKASHGINEDIDQHNYPPNYSFWRILILVKK
jgi:hypothetical protein